MLHRPVSRAECADGLDSAAHQQAPSGTYRAPGRYEGSFFCERLIELAARELGIDSAEMRRRNLIGAGEMPYRLPRLEPGGPAVDTECDSGDYRETFERCLAEFGWEEKRALQCRETHGRHHRVAVACFIEGCGAGPKETALLDLEADGTVSVYVGSAAVGQGLETVLAQIAADTLGLPHGQVRVLHGSTPFLDEGYGAFASRSTVLGGSAVFEAANALLTRIRAAAAARLGCAAEQVELADGCARAPDGRSLALAELAADSLRVTTAFGNENRMTYTYGSAARHKHCRGSWRMAGTEPHAWAVFECLRLSGPSTANRPALLSNSIVLRPFSLSQHPHGVRVSEHAGHAYASARAGGIWAVSSDLIARAKSCIATQNAHSSANGALAKFG
jgi:hypothetical protein